MSNNVAVYGVCAAGCRRRVPSYAEFEESQRSKTFAEIAIAASDWITDSNIAPFTYKAAKPLRLPSVDGVTLSILAEATEQFLFGLALGAYDETNETVIIYAINQPTSEVEITVEMEIVGGGDIHREYALVERTLTEYENDTIQKVGCGAFIWCEQLGKVDFSRVESIGECAFQKCTALTAVILRSNSLCSLSATNAFSETPIETGGGYIYVPAALVYAYKTASNWTAYADKIRALESYTVDGTITGELDINKI